MALARTRSPDSSGARVQLAAACQKRLSGLRPPAWSQTHAATARRPRHARHLAQAGDRVGHEVHDELRERDVERAVGERQLLGGGTPDVDAGMAVAGGRDERLGRVDGATASAPSRSTSSAVSAPGPQPTSSARCPGSTPAKSASRRDGGVSTDP